MLLWVPGLLFLLYNKEGRPHRVLGVIYVTALGVLLANPHSKAEYLGPAYTMLFAAGGVAAERWMRRGRRRWAVASFAVLSVLVSVLMMPFAMPVLPVEAFIDYSAALGAKPTTSENLALSELPQHFADMFGWEELARNVSAVYRELAAPERASAVVLARNYGEAGALEYYASRYDLPVIISVHNNYWLWGYPRETFGTVIVLGGREEDHRQACDEVVLAAVHTCRYCIPYENNMPLFVCRGVRVTPAELWAREKDFE
jgi:hypothetical protein